MVDITLHSSTEKVVEDQLDDRIQAIETTMKADVITFFGSILFGNEGIFRYEVEGMARSADKKEKLVVILETAGGYIGVVERIVETLRYHYEKVEFIVPDFAMSAGTVLVMSGDKIHMDYFSILGPIDPQVGNKSGQPVSAQGYLIQYDELIEKAKNGSLSTVEATMLIESFDQGDLYQYKQARQLSISLLTKWLVKYKFRNWNKTKDTPQDDTDGLRETHARTIAEKLSNPNLWHSHGRGISMEILRRDMELEIEDFGRNRRLSDAIQIYCSLLRNYMMRLQHAAVLHRRGSYVTLSQG